MAKIAKKYLEVDPWKIIEKGFNAERALVSESLFSLGNEYMGVRGYFEESYTGERFIGSFFNGVYEYEDVIHPQLFKGLITKSHFMVNAVNFLPVRILAGSEELDINTCNITDFVRELDMHKGTLRRSMSWTLKDGSQLNLSFCRFLNMTHVNQAGQQICIESNSFTGNVSIEFGVDFNTIHEAHDLCYWNEVKKDVANGIHAIMGETLTSKQRALSAFKVQCNMPCQTETITSSKYIASKLSVLLIAGDTVQFDKLVYNNVEKNTDITNEKVWQTSLANAAPLLNVSFADSLALHEKYWDEIWQHADIIIEGDAETQQGIRFCIFNLIQTYHGVDPSLNISAKGLTGESYCGWTWWDTETYCLPFYMFTNPQAAQNLLGYRYKTLPQAMNRAIQLGCKGARYPMTTINGEEACGTWQHGDLEIHVSAAISYGIWHYDRVCIDKPFLYTQGIEILIQVSRYFASRGEFGQLTGKFGMWGVMGADEFHMMVHNNCYTNVMAQKAFEFTLKVLAEMQTAVPDKLKTVIERTGLTNDEKIDWKMKSDAMFIPLDHKTGIYEQHDGYFNMPHVDVEKIPDTDFPLYKSWPYIKLFRYDMTKQPDVLLLHFFFSQEYGMENKRANYEYYEPRCSHESSLSPGIFSILANELGMHKKAFDYVNHASRLDLDDYNNNAHEGIHNTSMAAAWMSMVYGFGGLRSDGECLVFNPAIPEQWKSLSFKLLYRGSLFQVKISSKKAEFELISGKPFTIKVQDKMYQLSATEPLKVSL